jgi:hypothetical protein
MPCGIFFPDQIQAIRRAVDIVSRDAETDEPSAVERRLNIARITFHVAQTQGVFDVDDLVARAQTELRRRSSLASAA